MSKDPERRQSSLRGQEVTGRQPDEAIPVDWSNWDMVGQWREPPYRLVQDKMIEAIPI